MNPLHPDNYDFHEWLLGFDLCFSNQPMALAKRNERQWKASCTTSSAASLVSITLPEEYFFLANDKTNRPSEGLLPLRQRSP